MTYTPTREDLELAALACGLEIDWFNGGYHKVYDGYRLPAFWQPHLPTTQGKADLLDMMLACDMTIRANNEEASAVAMLTDWFAVPVNNGDKHAALMEAALKVAAQIGKKMKEDS